MNERHSARQLQYIFDYSPFGMIVLDSGGHVQYANAAVHRLFERDDDQMRGEALYRFLHGEDVDAWREQCDELQRRNYPRAELNVRVVRPDGTAPWCRVNVSYVTPEAGSPFLFALAEDITEQKRDEDQLRREKEIAERATRTKSAFLANMSHEIRTPIHTITGMAELLMETSLDPEQREYGQQIRFAADVLLGLINDILDFSKIEAGKLSLELIDFDVARTIEEAVDMVSLEAHKKSLDVVLDIDPRIPRYVKGDPVRIRQVVVNLFNNAVKFTNEGSITIQVRSAASGGGSSLIVRVNDTGVGVPRDKLGRLFKPFSQVDSSTTRRFGGTGLGLSICRSLVEMMNGRIGVQSSETGGSSFWFTIPVKLADGYMGESWIPTLSARTDKPILLVDDNAGSRETLTRYLRTWGLHVDSVASGERALGRLREAAVDGRPYVLALVDMMLPGIDGWHVASEVNADKRINDTRLLLMTPTGIMGGEAKMKLLNWFNAYVSKPVKWEELAAALDMALGNGEDLESAEDALPVEELDELPSESNATDSPTAPSADTIVVTRTARVLVAEDHQVNQQLFRTILDKLGHEVSVADNGRIALKLVDRIDPHIVFLDVQMPEMGGYEAARTLRDRGFDRPIIAVTANAQSGEREKCIDYGMDDFMAKPFKPNDVRRLLARWLTDELFGDDGEERSGNATDDELVFDMEGALEAFMGKREVVDRVMDGFLARLGEQISELRQALDAKDTERVHLIAHSIKGGALSLEARRLGSCAAQLEKVARGEASGDLSSLVEELAEHAEALRERWSAMTTPAGGT